MIDKCKFGQRFCRVPAFHIYRFTITTIPAMNYVSSKGVRRFKVKEGPINLALKTSQRDRPARADANPCVERPWGPSGA